MTGRLIGIARAPQKGGTLEELDRAEVTVERGIAGDARGHFPGRQVMVLFRDGWDAACRELGVPLPWTLRRANLYLDGVAALRRAGAKLRIGEVVLEATGETAPCDIMERSHAGLRRALMPDWRGGVCCRVVEGGAIRLDDSAEILAEQ